MERNSSPLSNSESMASSPPSSPGPDHDATGGAEAAVRKKKGSRKKRKTSAGEDADEPIRKHKKPKQKRKEKPGSSEDGGGGHKVKKIRKKGHRPAPTELESGLSAAQLAVNEQMRRTLEEDKYSANGSIVETDSDDDDRQYVYRGASVRLDRNTLLNAARKHLWLERVNGSSGKDAGTSGADHDEADARRKPRKKNKKGKRSKEDDRAHASSSGGHHESERSSDMTSSDRPDNEYERDEGSIFGQTTGSSNSTWVECDKCKKWRRLRGVVDEKKLPSKWYCSMNKNDPDRARCSAPEEEYDASHTPESAADARTRKHLRVWVRRLQCNEAYEARQPTLTRGKKRAVSSSSKDPYEWIRCCNPSCGKWRVILRIMDAKANVIDRTTDGEWYCVMNTWDEKTASCAAPQENLPAIGCPPWIMQDEN